MIRRKGSVVLTELDEVLRPSSIGAFAKCWRQSCATASWIGLGESPSAVSKKLYMTACILQHCESHSPLGPLRQGSIKSKSAGLWTACECTGHSELLGLDFSERFKLGMRAWDKLKLDPSGGLVFHLWPLLSLEEFTSEVQRVRGEQVTIPGEKVFFLLGKETLNVKVPRRSWALVHDSNRMTARAMRRRPAMKQQQPFEETVL